MMWPILTVLCGAVTLLFVVLRQWMSDPRPPPGTRLPPMPPAQSIRGHLEVYRRDFYHKKAIEWSTLYGPVFRLKVNFMKVVVLNDVDSIRKFASRSEALLRSEATVRDSEFFEGYSLGMLNGDTWKANKTFCMGAIRDVPFPNTSTEELIAMSFRRLEQKIIQAKGEPLNIYRPLLAYVSSNVMFVLFGSEVLDTPGAEQRMVNTLCQVGAALFEGPLFKFLSRRVQRWLGCFSFTRNGRYCKVGRLLDDFVEQQIEIFKQRTKDGVHFIQAYTDRIEKEKREENPLFQHRFLVGIVKDFLVAGSLSTANRLHWHFVNFAAHPDTLQARIQEEIDTAVGPHRTPTWEDRKRMPFTLACVWEMDRWRTPAPLAVPREVSKDLVVDDFFIPKGTAILFNIWAAHNDPTYWKEPHRFDPSRFLTDEGSILPSKPQHLMPFSVGRRSCLGEAFATVEMFLLITFVLQKYRVLLHQPLHRDINDPQFGTLELHSAKLRFIPRTVADV